MKSRLTVKQRAEKLGVTEGTIYKRLRVTRAKREDPLKPLYDLARNMGVSRNIATSVVTPFRLSGLRGLRGLRRIYKAGKQREFITALLTTTDSTLKSVMAAHDSGVRARMSKAKA